MSDSVIESSGTTNLLTDGTNYYLQVGEAPAIELSYGGTPVVAGEFGPWTLIAAQQTTSGYEIALYNAGAGQYDVWYTDSSGNMLSDASGFVSGTSAALESYETSFNYDLNGDGVIGVPPPPPPTLIESSGTTSLLQSGNNYLLKPNGGTAVELSYNGTPVVAGEFGPWTLIAAQQTTSGYEIALYNAAAGQYDVWHTDSSGNMLSDATGSVSGTSATLESLETSFNYDLNGDGVIGVPPPPPPTLIESSGTTSLLQSGNNYLLEPNGGIAVDLSYSGSPVSVGEFGGWTPIAAAQTATGYEVALKLAGTNQYTIWYTDSSGNYLSSAFNSAAGTSALLESFEPSFNDDLNGDGTIGFSAAAGVTVVESSGTTSLLTDGTNYFLQPAGGRAVPLSLSGAPVGAGAYGSWTPIAAQQTATGYEVAWENVGADQYGVWDTDSSGNYVSDPVGSVSGTSATLESLETSFDYDLNGDGVIGVPPPPPPRLIESSGTTSLLQSGNNYLLEPNGGTTVELSYGGSPAVVGEFGGWTPIAAQQTSTGYEVALELAGATQSANQYTIWNTDSSGNFLATVVSPVSGSNALLESYEPSFNDDLNGDGAIGFPAGSGPTVIESSGTTSLLLAGDNYLIESNGGPAVELNFGGPVTAGEFAGWIPIAARQTSTGYQVAWRAPGSDQYGVWNTDSSGNYVSDAYGTVSGTSAQLESAEVSFNDDLNNDGVIGTPPASNQPLFAYQGTDAEGAQVYDITWNDQGNHPFAVRVLVPTNPSADYAHSFLYALSVGSGFTQQTYGSGLNVLESEDVEDKYNTTIIEPIFPTDSWYADNPNDSTIDYYTFLTTILPKWVDANFSTTGSEKNLLLGFSKSGYGALDVLLKNPTEFDAAAAFDFPADMTSYTGFGTSSGNNYGTQANFQNNYELDQSFIDTYKTPFTTQDRIWISGGPDYANQVADFNNLLTSQGVKDTFVTTQTGDAHTWTGGWVSSAVAGLFGLEQNLHPGANS
jgi:hypothetical protein